MEVDRGSDTFGVVVPGQLGLLVFSIAAAEVREILQGRHELTLCSRPG